MNPTETPRQKALKALSSRYPVNSQSVNQGLQAAQQIGLQSQIQQAPTGMSTRAAQQAAPQAVQQQTQGQLQTLGDQRARLTQVGQLGLQEQGREQRQVLANSQLAQGQTQLKAEDQLFRLGQTVKQEIYDKNLTFAKDELGRTQLNDRQLLDWSIVKANNQIEANKAIQDINFMTNRDLKIYEHAHKLVMQDLQNKMRQAEQQKDQASRQRISQALAEAERQMEKKKADAANKMAKNQAIGTVIGAGIGLGASGGSPSGAMAGASIGGAVSSLF